MDGCPQWARYRLRKYIVFHTRESGWRSALHSMALAHNVIARSECFRHIFLFRAASLSRTRSISVGVGARHVVCVNVSICRKLRNRKDIGWRWEARFSDISLVGRHSVRTALRI